MAYAITINKSYIARALKYVGYTSRDPFVRFVSIQHMSTPIRTDYEALVGFVGF